MTSLFRVGPYPPSYDWCAVDDPTLIADYGRHSRVSPFEGIVDPLFAAEHEDPKDKHRRTNETYPILLRLAVTITLTGTPIIAMVPILISTMPAVESLEEDDAEAFAASIFEDALLMLPPSTLPPPWLLLPLVHALVGHAAHVSHRPHPGDTVLRIAATLEEGN
jgi:hypothetical protein